jgi:isocitrate/isopropylmalate dehydrogenase
MYKVNPIATILAAKMMLDWIGETAKGAAVEAAIAAVIREGQARTYDMGGKSSSLDIGRAVAAKL